MKIKTKIVLSIMGCLLIGVVSAILIVTKISLPYVENEEIQNIQSDIEKASLVLGADLQVLERTQRDWTWWDDTYYFANGEDSTYIDSNLGEAILEQLNLVGMLYFDKHGNSIYSEYLNKNFETIVRNEIEKKDVLKELFKQVDKNHPNSGITLLNQKLYMISVAGITSTDGLSPMNGYLIMIKELDDNYISYLEKILDADIRYDKGTISDHNAFSGISLLDYNRDGNVIHYEGSTHDILNDNSIIFRADGKRLMYENAVDTLKNVIVTLVLVFFVISFIVIVAMEKWGISRILYLTNFVRNVVSKNDMSLRMQVKGKDELASLGNNINYMLEELEKNYIMVEKNDEHLHLIMEATNDGFFDYDILKGEIKINRAWLHYLGYHDAADTTINIEKVRMGIVNDDRESFHEALDEYLHNHSDIFYKEVRAYKAGRGYIWVLIRGRVIEYGNDKKATRFIGSLSDITKRKENEQKNIYLLQTDPVTNLKNRSYLENKIKEFDETKMKDFCIIMADVNGLKLMNDAFGHREGDRLLSTVGEIIKLCCSETDIPARWGGDEFLILIKNNRQYADGLMNNIRKEFDLIDIFPIKISLAMGCAAHKDTDTEVEQVLCRAEEKMYRNKLLEARSFHNGIIASFEQTIYEKKIETSEQIRRRKKLCLQMGELMRLSPEAIDELVLLNQLHDVGKISLPDYIILNKENLSEEEWNLRKKHVESGYRIAKAIPEIAHIANSILYHHENYDGSGYPDGIEGKTIPLNSRIFSVISFYDSLVNGLNQAPVNIEEAKQEIINRSGKQFDPDIVQTFLKDQMGSGIYPS